MTSLNEETYSTHMPICF